MQFLAEILHTLQPDHVPVSDPAQMLTADRRHDLPHQGGGVRFHDYL